MPKSKLSPKPASATDSTLCAKPARLNSLLDRLQRASIDQPQADSLLHELLFFLEEPPDDVTDRWQAGAELCRRHGIETSRMSVWRLYQEHILQWRREQRPVPPACVEAAETARLHEQARHLAAQRLVDALSDPKLSTGHLVALLQSENQRIQLELTLRQFDDRVTVRRGHEKRDFYRRLDEHAREKAMIPAQKEVLKNAIKSLLSRNASPTS